MRYTQEQKIENMKKVDKLVGGDHYFYTDANLIDLFLHLKESDEDEKVNDSKYVVYNYTRNGVYCANLNRLTELDKYVSPEQIYKTLGIKQEKQTMNDFPKLEIGKHLLLVNITYTDTPTKRYAIYMGDYIAYIDNDKKFGGWDRLNNTDDGIPLSEVEEVYEIDNITTAMLLHKSIWKKSTKQLRVRKELEFAKAKAERLAAHISVLESKIK